MATIVDSRKQKLDGPTVIANSFSPEALKKQSLQDLLLVLASEMAMDDVYIVQFGNTVFLGHILPVKPESPKTKGIWMRAFNADTAHNLLHNGTNYFKRLFNLGITDVYTMFADEKFLNLFKAQRRKEITKGETVRIYPVGDGSYEVHITFGSKLA